MKKLIVGLAFLLTLSGCDCNTENDNYISQYEAYEAYDCSDTTPTRLNDEASLCYDTSPYNKGQCIVMAMEKYCTLKVLNESLDWEKMK